LHILMQPSQMQALTQDRTLRLSCRTRSDLV